MVQRRVLLTGMMSVGVSALAGCPTSVPGGFGGGGASLTQQKKEIVQTYDKGFSESNSGTRAWNSALPLFNDSEYSDAVTKFESALDHFETAKQLFAKAETKAREIGQDESARLCADAAERSGLMAEAASAGREAAKAGANGEDAATINSKIQAAQETAKKATEIDLRQTSVLQKRLKDGGG